VSVTASAMPSLTDMPMLAAPSESAVKVASARAVLISSAVPVSWIPSVLSSASLRLLIVPLVVVMVTVKLSSFASATVKSAKAVATPVVTDWAVPGIPPMLGASLPALTSTVTVCGPYSVWLSNANWISLSPGVVLVVVKVILRINAWIEPAGGSGMVNTKSDSGLLLSNPTTPTIEAIGLI